MTIPRVLFLFASCYTALLLGLPARPLAHTAPSGMAYDPSCCGGYDCRQLSDADVPKELEQDATGWIILPTHEHIPFQSRAIHTSTDGHYHRCSGNFGDPHAPTYCIYIPSQA